MKATPRWQTLDRARGWAVIAMIGFHIIWDLAHFGYIAENIAWAPPFKAFGHIISTSLPHVQTKPPIQMHLNVQRALMKSV